jgi:hypothetical protein
MLNETVSAHTDPPVPATETSGTNLSRVKMSGPDMMDYTGSKNSTVLYAGALLTGMTSASFLFNFILIVVLVIKKRYSVKFFPRAAHEIYALTIDGSKYCRFRFHFWPLAI